MRAKHTTKQVDPESKVYTHKPKGPIKFKVELNEEQKVAKQTILDNKITVLTGGPGSGKSLLAVQTALDLLFKKEVDKIYIARPFVYSEGVDLGVLPGGIQEKLIGITTPLLENMYSLCGVDKIDSLLQEGLLVILPLAFMRGMTIANSVLIIDECQNARPSQIFDCLTRFGKGSKMIITGDMSQCDLKDRSTSGFGFFDYLTKTKVKKYSVINLSANHRDEIVQDIVAAYTNYKNG